MRHWPLALALSLWSLSCGTRQPAVPTPQEGDGVFGEWVGSGGYQRTYKLFVPAGHDGRTPLPLVVVLHGASGTGAGIRTALAMDAAAQRHGFVAVYPDGVASWAIGLGTNADYLHVDDLLFMRTLVTQLAANLPIDRRRVYAVGFSDGASMSYRIGCGLADEFAAVAGISSGLPGFSQHFGRPQRALPVLMLSGTSDEIFSAQSVAATAREWADLDGCRTQDEQPAPELSPDGRAITRTAYGECTAGVEVVLYMVEGGRHTTAVPLAGTTLADLVVDFFERSSKPE